MSSKPVPAMPKEEKDYEAEDAHRTLMQAEEIKENAPLMKRVAKIAGRKHKAISKLKDLVDLHKEKYPKKSSSMGS